MKKSIVKLLAVGMLLGGAVVPATVANNGLTPQITTVQTAKAASTTSDSDQAQTVTYKVLKTGTQNASISSQYFTKTAKVTPNSDGTYKVTLTVKVPAIASVDILTMDGKKVTDSDQYSKDGSNYIDVSFNVDKLSDLDGTLNSTMQIKVAGMDLMKPTADFVFDTSNLKEVKPTTDDNSDTDTDSGDVPNPEDDPVLSNDPTGSTGGNQEITNSFNNNSVTIVVIGTPVKTDANGKKTNSTDPQDNVDPESDSILPDGSAASGQESSSNAGTDVVADTPSTSDSSESDVQEIPYQVLKADASQGESVSTQFFTGKAKVTKNDDGTYKVSMTMTYPNSYGTSPVTIDSINGGSINPDDTKYYSSGDQNLMDFSFNINSMSDLDNLVPCTMTINIPDLFSSTESVNFKFNATSSGVAGTSAVGSSSATNPSGVYGSTSDWPSSTGTSSDPSNPSTSNSTLPQTGNTNNSIILTAIGVAVAAMSFALYKGTYGMKKVN